MCTNHRITALMLVCFLAPAPLSAAVIEPLVRVVDLDTMFGLFKATAAWPGQVQYGLSIILSSSILIDYELGQWELFVPGLQASRIDYPSPEL